MVSRLFIPRNISEYIRESGKKEAKKGREAIGMLFGLYNEIEDSIMTSQIYSSPPKIGHPSLGARLYDRLILHFISSAFRDTGSKIALHAAKLMKEGKVPAVVYYHTHRKKYVGIGSVWSDSDLSVNSEDFENRSGLKSAQLLHTVDTNEFFGINSKREYIPVIILD